MSSSAASSASESEYKKISISRLGECEVCGDNNAIYSCPKCEVKTCCLTCVQIHKKELKCDGVRDRTKFIRVKEFTDTDLLSDYRLLEECARFVYGVKRDEKKRFTRIDKELPIHLYKLKLAARKRGIAVQFLAQNFTRHRSNTTRYNYKTNIISWRVEWVFPNVDTKPLKFVDARCQEHKRLSELLDRYLNPETVPFEGSKGLTFYKSIGASGVKVLLRAEKVKGSAKKFFELDPMESLAENLSGKCIVEFPIIFVVLKDHAYNFEIVTPEDEFDCDKQASTESNDKEATNQIENGVASNNILNRHYNNKNVLENNQQVHCRKRPRQLLTKKIAIQKQMAIEKELKEERKKRPKNLLFTTGYSSEESLGGTDSETES